MANISRLLANIPLIDEAVGVCYSNVVLDVGSYETRAGISGQYEPHKSVRTVYASSTDSMQVADVAWQQQLTNPVSPIIDKGVVANWAALEAHFKHLLTNVLHVPSESPCPVFITERPFESPADREKKAEILFETLNVPAVRFLNGHAASLISCGLTSGLVCDASQSSFTITPVYEGFAVTHAAISAPSRGGGALTLAVRDAIAPQISHLAPPVQLEAARYVKEIIANVPPEPLSEDHDSSNGLGGYASQAPIAARLPDGTAITIPAAVAASVGEAIVSTQVPGGLLPFLDTRDMAYPALVDGAPAFLTEGGAAPASVGGTVGGAVAAAVSRLMAGSVGTAVTQSVVAVGGASKAKVRYSCVYAFLLLCVSLVNGWSVVIFSFLCIYLTRRTRTPTH